MQLQTEEQLLNEHQRYAVRGQRVDTKAMSLLTLKMVDVIESYNLDRPENKVKINNLPANMNVYRLPELFQLVAMVFGRLKDEKDMMLERMKKNRIKVGDGNLCKLNDHNGVLDQQGEFSLLEKLEMFIQILEKCIVDSSNSAKTLNKLHDCLLKIKTAYEHYQEQLLYQERMPNNPGYYDFYMCISDETIGT